MRTEQSLGCGEFSDLRYMVDWADACGMRMVQILPVNDTIANYSWIDSYPYAAVSVFALHPIYLNLDGLEQAVDKAAFAKKQALNALPEVDYEQTLAYKLAYTRKVYDKVFATWEASSAFKAFLPTMCMAQALCCLLPARYLHAQFQRMGYASGL
ncbi:MAG: 4-alpha-glucanotransferase [Saprospiraceae bacterium]